MAGPEGKLCFLSSDDSDGHLSYLADNTEAVQLGMAAELLEPRESYSATRRRRQRSCGSWPPT